MNSAQYGTTINSFSQRTHSETSTGLSVPGLTGTAEADLSITPSGPAEGPCEEIPSALGDGATGVLDVDSDGDEKVGVRRFDIPLRQL